MKRIVWIIILLLAIGSYKFYRAITDEYVTITSSCRSKLENVTLNVPGKKPIMMGTIKPDNFLTQNFRLRQPKGIITYNMTINGLTREYILEEYDYTDREDYMEIRAVVNVDESCAIKTEFY